MSPTEPSAGPCIAIAGIDGRMGRAVRTVLEAQALCWVEDYDAADVVIDFTSAPGAADLVARLSPESKVALVIGSTGFTPAQAATIEDAARRRAIVKSGNFSLGVNVLLGLVAQAARALGPEAYDIEIGEAHHRRKLDAPSGTALMLGAAAAAGREVPLDAVEVRARDGVTGPRAPGEIGFSVVRGGGIVGEHSVMFAAEDEILTLSHSARDRSLFARGAVSAALWVANRPPGLYDMQDVLGFRDARIQPSRAD